MSQAELRKVSIPSLREAFWQGGVVGSRAIPLLKEVSIITVRWLESTLPKNSIFLYFLFVDVDVNLSTRQFI